MRSCQECGKEFKSHGHKSCDHCRRPYQNKPIRNAVTAFGDSKTLRDWSNDFRCSVSFSTLRARISRDNWPSELAITAAKGYRYWSEERICSVCDGVFQAVSPHQISCGMYCNSKKGGDKRRATQRNAYVEDINRGLLFEDYQGLCYLCWTPLDPNDWHLEHVIPISRGGLHERSNVAPAHPLCNLRKNSKTYLEYVKYQLDPVF